MVLLETEILDLVEKPKAKNLLERGRLIYKNHRLHLKGEGLLDFLSRIEGFENKTQFDLRKKLAKPATVPVFAKETDMMNKVFSAQGFTRYYQFTPSTQERFSQDFTAYLNSDIGDGLTLRQWMRDVWLDKVNFDCNGVFMLELPKEQKGALPEPYLTFRSVEDIHDILFKGGTIEYIIFKNELKDKDGVPYCEYRVVDSMFDYIVVAKDGNYTIDRERTIPNVWGYVPAKFISNQRDSKSIARTTYIWKSIDTADEYLLEASVHSITKKLHGFPRYWERQRGCNKCGGTGGIMYTDIDGITPLRRECGDCKGTGQLMKSDVSDKIIVPTLTANGQPDNVPVGGYIQIDNETTRTQVEFLDRLEHIIHKGIWANREDDKKQTEADTATGVMVDVQSIWDKLFLISENAQEVERFVVNGIGSVRYGSDYLGSIINYGKKYYIRTANEVEQLYKTAKESGMSSALLDAYLEELIYVRFGNDPLELDRQLKLKVLEPFVHLSVKEVSEMQGVPVTDKAMKLYFSDFIDRYEEEEKPITVATIKEVQDKMKVYLKEKVDVEAGEVEDEQGGGDR